MLTITSLSRGSYRIFLDDRLIGLSVSNGTEYGYVYKVLSDGTLSYVGMLDRWDTIEYFRLTKGIRVVRCTI